VHIYNHIDKKAPLYGALISRFDCIPGYSHPFPTIPNQGWTIYINQGGKSHSWPFGMAANGREWLRMDGNGCEWMRMDLKKARFFDF
jgi:hypothetical protein